MAKSTRRSIRMLLLVAGLTLASTGTASGQPPPEPDGATDDPATHAETNPDDQQHGGIDGHLPPRSESVELISKLRLTDVPGRIADVTVFNDTAYLAAFAEPCGEGGVYVVDISDVANPVQTGFIPTAENSFVGEGVQVIKIVTPRFRGDVLIFNNEICGPSESAVGGATLVDVTDPANPKVLAAGFGDFDTDGVPDGDSVAHLVHSAFAWRTGLKAYAVLVDDEEAGSADVDIFDISNPRRPSRSPNTTWTRCSRRSCNPRFPT